MDEVEAILQEAVTDRRRLRETTELREASRVRGSGYAGNNQAFVNNPSTGLTPGEADTFHGGEPNLSIIRERPEHYLILVALARGSTREEISEKTGYSAGWLSQIVRQPWAKERLFQIMRESGKDIIQETLRLEVMPSIMTMVEIRDNPQAPARARLAASQDLLDRFLGKAVQRVETLKVEPTDLADAAALDKRIQESQREIERLEGAKSEQGVAGAAVGKVGLLSNGPAQELGSTK